MIIRLFNQSDAEPLLHLFFNTIRTVNLGDYSQEQVEAWAPAISTFDPERWKNSFKNKFVFVAESEEKLAGFGELEADGHIDRFYISHHFIGEGVGRKMYSALEEKAFALNIRHLFVEASITAKPFFEKMGFSLINEQIVERNGQRLKNYKMEKFLK